LANKRIKQAW